MAEAAVEERLLAADELDLITDLMAETAVEEKLTAVKELDLITDLMVEAAVEEKGKAAAGGEEEGGEEKPCAMVRMPDKFITIILSLKGEPVPSAEYLASLSPEELEEELATIKRGDELEELQAEVREGLRKDGYYLVEESYLTEAAAVRDMVKEAWAKMDWSGLTFGEWDPECVTYR
uniref:Uncharacterized protein n=1 Tax=Oryza brachyantha TaxID=4533 RepID=J3N9I5_ORYBR